MACIAGAETTEISAPHREYYKLIILAQCSWPLAIIALYVEDIKWLVKYYRLYRKVVNCYLKSG